MTFNSFSFPAKQSFWEKLSRRKRIAFVGAVAAAVVALITLTVLLTDISTNGQSGIRDGDDGRIIIPMDSNISKDQERTSFH